MTCQCTLTSHISFIMCSTSMMGTAYNKKRSVETQSSWKKWLKEIQTDAYVVIYWIFCLLGTATLIRNAKQHLCHEIPSVH